MDLQEIYSNNYARLVLASSLALSSLLLVKKKYLTVASFTSRARLDNKTVLITGANSGIGLAAAQDLASRGATVILACRDFNKGQAALTDVKKRSKNPNVFLELVDLASLDSVKQFSNIITEKFEPIDILINNAGIMNCPYGTTENGFEYQFQVNYLSHYLLTRLILLRCDNNPPSRVINVTSKLYESADIDLDNLSMSLSTYNPLKAYKNSKLCNIFFSNYLERHLNKEQDMADASRRVGVYSVSPGVVLTKLGRHSLNTWTKKALAVVFYPLIYFLMRTPSEGAQTVLYCALEPDLKSGFYRDCKQNELKSHAVDEGAEQKLWTTSEDLVANWLK